MSVTLETLKIDSKKELEKITSFIKEILAGAKKKRVVIAVSGGIDSALSLTILTKVIPLENIYPIFLPYDSQDMTDAKLLVDFLKIPKSNYQEVNIKEIVDKVANVQGLEEIEDNKVDKLRLGNIMARARMIVVYDLAKKFDALVCGTENKSEKYLGYFTRFGDEASDFEPIVHLYKSQVRQLVNEFGLPEIFLQKAPSAGLWADQTDEQELGFSYQAADLVIDRVILNGQNKDSFSKETNISIETIDRVIDRVKSVKFKHQVPYTL